MWKSLGESWKEVHTIKNQNMNNYFIPNNKSNNKYRYCNIERCPNGKFLRD